MKTRRSGKKEKLVDRRWKIVDKAPYENEVQYMYAFSQILEKHIQDIGIEDSGAPYQGNSYIEWGKMRCRKCRMCYETAEVFLEHTLHCQFTKTEQEWYAKYRVVTAEVQDVLDEALDERAENSYIAKPVMNSNEIRCTIPIKSPLAPYFWRGMSIYYGKPPGDLRRVIPGVLNKHWKTHRLFFTARLIERQIDEILKIKEVKSQKKRYRELRKVCQKFSINVDDIILNETARNREQTRDLSVALGLGNTLPTQTEIMKKLEVAYPTPNGIRICRGNAELVKSEIEGIVLKPKQAKSVHRHLTSEFTSNFLKPASAKRQSTFRAGINR